MKKLTAGILTVALCSFITPGVSAEQKDKSPFLIEPIFTKDQVVTQTAYPHLKAEPNTTYTLTYNATNQSDQPLEIVVSEANMLTSSKGQYYFEDKTEHEGSTINEDYKITELLEFEETITLAPKEKKKLSYTVKIPDVKTKGLIVGGLVFVPDQKIQKVTEGITVNYEMQKVLPIKLDFSPTKFKLPVIDHVDFYDKAVVFDVENIIPDLLRQGVGKVTVKDINNKSIFEKNIESYEMAPMTSVKYKTPLEGGIKEGIYTGILELDFNGEKVKYEGKFEVTAEKAQSKVPIEPFNLLEDGVPFWVWILLGILLLGIGILIFLKRKKKKALEPEQQ